MHATTQIDVVRLEQEFLASKHELDKMQIYNMENTIHDMRYGADALIGPDRLPPLDDPNSKSVLLPDVAHYYTDQLASMVKKGYVSGPFDDSPIPGLRINSLFAVNQGDKYRPILNLSKPEGNSYNEAIHPAKMRKVTMSTSRQAADTIYNMGQGSIISKVDHVSAFKLVPIKPAQYYLQGFRWLGKLWIEVRLIFGAKSSVPNYDNLHDTISDLVRATSNTDKQFLLRTLDDQVIITKTLEQNQLFIESYLALADRINLPLADTSGSDKAFLYRTAGIILGVYFDTINMTWMYSARKRLTHMKMLQDTLRGPTVTLNQMQKVAGVVNTLTLLCPPLKFLRAPIIQQMSDAYSFSPLPLRAETKTCLHVWLHVFHDLQYGFPIPRTMSEPPLTVLAFVTDAAGLPDPTVQLPHDVGAGAVGFITPFDQLFYAGQATWPLDFVTATDTQRKFFGRKTTLLEALGLFLPLYHNASKLHGKHVILYVDNLATVWSYKKGKSKTDPYSSVIISALNHIAVSLHVKLYVKHCPRLSTKPAIMADLLTRTDTKGMNMVRSWHKTVMLGWPPALLTWMSNPTLDWQLGAKLLTDFTIAS